jgi:hypothetical protein
VSDVGENLVLEQLGEDGCPLGATAGAETTAFTRESNQELATTLWTKDAGETGLEEPTIEVARDGGIPEGSPESVSSLESLFPLTLEGLKVGLEELIEGRGPRIARPVEGRTVFGLREGCGSCRHGAHGG